MRAVRPWFPAIILPCPLVGMLTLRHGSLPPPGQLIKPVEVTPDGTAITATAHATGWHRGFLVKNLRSQTTTYTLSCASTGQVTCGTVDPSRQCQSGYR